jgi:DNA gyrase inhibitor GyrI
MKNLNLTPDQIQWPESNYIFIEKVGPFMTTAKACWQELQPLMPQVAAMAKVSAACALYKIHPEMIYRAGVVVQQIPKGLPAGLQSEKFAGGKYARFVLKGSYAQLPEACGVVFNQVEKLKLPVRKSAFYIENYVNDPKTTPEADLITEILIPIE